MTTLDARPHLLDRSLAEIEGWCAEAGEPRYRARQIARWALQRGVTEFEAMTDLPAALRSRLAATFRLAAPAVLATTAADDGATMKVLLDRIRERGGAKEIHVRVACPPIVAPCFYGIDMSTVNELFAPKYLQGGELTPEIQARMAKDLGADSLRYLPIASIAHAIGFSSDQLCQACITGQYPTDCGQRLYQIALDNVGRGDGSQRTYEAVGTAR